MAGLTRLPWVPLLVRSLAIQGSWNYKTMQGAGLGFALIPALERLHGGDPSRFRRALGRHCRFFNAHPYLSTVALAAVARMEGEGEDEGQMERFKGAVVSPLGGLGDRLVWARWRPFCLLVALLLFVTGAAWWLATLTFLVLYNAGHLALRIWGLRLGWRYGQRVGQALIGSPLRRIPDRLTIPLALVAGLLLPVLSLGLAGTSGPNAPLPVLGAAVLSAVLGAWRPALASRLAVLGAIGTSLALVTLGLAW